MMTTTPRSITQPGPPAAQRIESLAGLALRLEFKLQPGLSLRDALIGPLAQAGLEGATVRIQGLQVRGLRYVRPALPKDDQHVAFYSDTHELAGPLTLRLACATIGRKDGEAFVHCHAVWADAQGMEHGGHLFCDQIVIAAPANAQAWGLAGVRMQADFDPETNFSLFHPVAVEARATSAIATRKRCAIARIRPNVDLVDGIEAVCRRHGFAAAKVRGSIGSIVGARFEDGGAVDDIATEIMVVDGAVVPGAAGPAARLDIALIDPRGDVHRGRLQRGANPVLICFELVLEEAEPAAVA